MLGFPGAGKAVTPTPNPNPKQEADTAALHALRTAYGTPPRAAIPDPDPDPNPEPNPSPSPYH